MKLVALLAIIVCYFHSRCVNAQTTTIEPISTTTTMGMPESTPSPTVEDTSGSGSGDPIVTDEDTVTTMSNGTDSSGEGESSGLSTGAIVGIVVGVVALVVLVTLLVTIVIVLTVMKSKKTKVATISPSKPSTKDSSPDAKLTSHGKSQAMKELPIVDSS